MDKLKINYTIDVLLGISFLITAITGIIIFLFLPSGVKQGGYQLFLGITKNLWVAIHNYSGLAMIILSLVHLILHWDWMVCMTMNFFKRKEK